MNEFVIDFYFIEAAQSQLHIHTLLRENTGSIQESARPNKKITWEQNPHLFLNLPIP